jgi:hypothetical protein
MNGSARREDIVGNACAGLQFIEEFRGWPELLDFLNANVVCCEFLELVHRFNIFGMA